LDFAEFARIYIAFPLTQISKFSLAEVAGKIWVSNFCDIHYRPVCVPGQHSIEIRCCQRKQEEALNERLHFNGVALETGECPSVAILFFAFLFLFLLFARVRTFVGNFLMN
jgi:hypothetical protein